MEQILLDFYNKHCKKNNWLPYIQNRIEARQLHIPIVLDEHDGCYLDVLIDLDEWSIVINTDDHELSIKQFLQFLKVARELEQLIRKIKQLKYDIKQYSDKHIEEVNKKGFSRVIK